MPVQPSTRQLTDDQLRDLLRLTKGSDSVELKLTVPASGQRSAIRSLGVDPLDAQIRQVYFFDTPDLVLYGAGLNLRARRIQGKGEDSVVKIRPVEPEQLDAEWRLSPSMKVELDAMPGGYVCSASLKGKPKTGDTWKVAIGEEPIRRLFSKEQRAFFEAHAPGGLTMSDLSVLGPIFVLKVNFTPEGFNRQVTGEMWLYPDGRRLLELSTKCPPTEALQAATEFRLFLGDHGVDLSGTQETKTRSALQFFAKELRPAGKEVAADGVTDASDNGAPAPPQDVPDAVPMPEAVMGSEAEVVREPGAGPENGDEPMAAVKPASAEPSADADPD
jgi:hypothetical protein